MHATPPINTDLLLLAEKELLIAMKNCDVHKLDSLLHEDLLFMIPDGQTITKEMDLETYRSGKMIINKITSSEQKIRLIGDTAIVTATIEMTGLYFNHILDGTYRFMRIWKSYNATWQVIAGSSTQL